MAGLFVVICAFIAWRLSDKQVIKKKTEGFLEVITLGADVGSGGRKLNVYKLNGLLAESISISAPFLDGEERNLYREDVESAYTYLCDKAEETKFEMLDIESIEVDGDSAKIACTVYGLVQFAEVRRLDDNYLVMFHWINVEDQWRLKGMIWEEAP